MPTWPKISPKNTPILLINYTLINSSPVTGGWRGSTKGKTMEVIEIKSRWTETLLYSGEHVDVKEAVDF